MTDTLNAVFNLVGTADIGFGDSTSTFTQSDRLQTDGSTADASAQYVDSAVIPASTVAKNLFGLSGTKDLDDVFTEIEAGTFIGAATTSARGTVKISDAAADPVAVITTNAAYARILSAAMTAAVTGSAQTPDYGNAFVTRYESQLAQSLSLGSGKDGHGKMGAISATSTAPTITSTATAGLLTNATGYKYKISAYNLSGATVASSATASTGALTAKQVRLTLPALPANATGWRIYRETGGAGNYELVGVAVLGYNYTETANDARQYIWDDNQPYPNASQTAPGSDTTGNTATLSGRYEFLTLTLSASHTITVADTGVFAGHLDFHIRGVFYGSDTAWTITGTGKNAVNVGKLRLYAAEWYNGASAIAGAFTSLRADSTFTTASIDPWTGYTSQTLIARGLGADCSMIGQLLSGFGVAGAGTTGGVGGYGGARVRIWAYQFENNTLTGTINCLGAAGSAGATNGGGGGGGAGGDIDTGSVIPHRDNGTSSVAGGAGGAGAGSGRGGAGGGGGRRTRRNCWNKASATTSVAGGATGANGGTTADGGSGGAHHGNGGVNNSVAQTVATAGQEFDFNDLFAPSAIFAA